MKKNNKSVNVPEKSMDSMPENSEEIREIPEIKERVRKEKKTKLLETEEKKIEKNTAKTGVLPWKEFITAAIIILVVYAVATAFCFFMKKPLEKQEYAEKERICRKIFSDGSAFEEAAMDGDVYKKLEEAGYPDNEVESVIYVKDEREVVLGKVYYVISGNGYGGNISIALGIMENGMICGVEMTDSTEMEGFDSVEEERDYLEQFLYKKAAAFHFEEAGAISQYTIFSSKENIDVEKAVINAVNAGIMADGYLNGKGADNGE